MSRIIDFIPYLGKPEQIEHLGSFLLNKRVTYEIMHVGNLPELRQSAENLASQLNMTEWYIDTRLQPLYPGQNEFKTSQSAYGIQQRMLRAIHAYTVVYNEERIAVVGYPDQFALGVYALEHVALQRDVTENEENEYRERVLGSSYPQENTLWRLKFDNGFFRGREIIHIPQDWEGRLRPQERR